MAAPITKRKYNQILKLLQEMPKKKRQIAKLLNLSHEKVYQIARENGIIIQYTVKREKQATISIYKEDKAFLQMESDRLNTLRSGLNLLVNVVLVSSCIATLIKTFDIDKLFSGDILIKSYNYDLLSRLKSLYSLIAMLIRS